MILKDKGALTRWNGSNKKYYESKGYKYTNENDLFLVDIADLTKGSKAMITLRCDMCKKIYEKQYCKVARSKNNFCSSECYWKHGRKDPKSYKTLQCNYCNKEYIVKRSNNNSKFCSMKCRNNWDSIHSKGENNPNYKYGKIKICCDYCKSEYLVSPYKLRQSKNHFCSKKCRVDWFREVYSQQSFVKERSRERAVKILNNNKHLTKTSCQLKINNLLDDLNIKYENEYNCRYFSIDNYLLNYNLMIEVMGTYWHVDPRMYDKVIYDMQRRGIVNDKRKKTYVKNNYGINILYLWEDDINDNIKLIKCLILDYINNEGILDNYHSFNYKLTNNNLLLNNNIINPYAEISSKDLYNIVDIKDRENHSKKQKDKWITFLCEYCGKEKEQLITRYKKSKTHCCSRKCSRNLIVKLEKEAIEEVLN